MNRDFPFFRAHRLRMVDRYGQRDEAWNGGYGLAREALGVLGVRCLACGRKLWNAEGTGRIFCDDVCRDRHTKRRTRLRKHLRDAGRRCPYCNCKPSG